jgi:hypothetical protein
MPSSRRWRAHQEAMRHLMLRMVSGGAGSLVKRRVSDAELTFADPAEGARVQAVLARLTAARLVVEGTEADGTGYAEPAHDALVRGWGRLVGWIHAVNDEAVPLMTRQKLSGAALEWTAAEGPAKPGLLWSDTVRSAMLAPLVRARAPWLNAAELAFAAASVRGRRNARRLSLAVTAAIAVLAWPAPLRRAGAAHAAEARSQQQAATEAAASRGRRDTREPRPPAPAERSARPQPVLVAAALHVEGQRRQRLHLPRVPRRARRRRRRGRVVLDRTHPRRGREPPGADRRGVARVHRRPRLRRRTRHRVRAGWPDARRRDPGEWR